MAPVWQIIPIFTVILVGWVAGRRGLLPPEFQAPASRLAFLVALPALLVRATSHTPLHQGGYWLVAGWGALVVLAGCALAVLLARLLWPRDQPSGGRRASWIHIQFHGNLGIMGLAMVYYVRGEAWMPAASLVLGCMVIVQNLCALAVLAWWGDGAGGWRRGLRSMLHNPMVWAIVVGLLISALGWELPEPVDRTLLILANLGLPLALLLVGTELASPRRAPAGGGVWLPVAVKLVALPALAWGMLLLGGVERDAALLVLFMAAAPPATVTVILAQQLGGDGRLAAGAVSLGHALSALTYALWVWLWTP